MGCFVLEAVAEVDLRLEGLVPVSLAPDAETEPPTAARRPPPAPPWS